MIFIDEMKNLKIYKTPLFLPTMEDDKKRGSSILLLTPDYNSSKRIMNSPLFINRLRYSSYYIEKDVSYYIGRSNIKEVEESYLDYLKESSDQVLTEMSSAERNKLPDSAFGLPKQRKYPLDCRERVLSAIKFFNYVSKEDEKELADNINKAIDKFFDSGEYPTVGKGNRFYKYYKYKSVTESYDITQCFSWYHVERDSEYISNPENKGGWDEELYYKNFEDAVKAVNMKSDEDELKAYVYTASKDLEAIYLGSIIIKRDGVESVTWLWDKQEDISDDNIERIIDIQNNNKVLIEIAYKNDKGAEVPKICPKCGGEVKVFLRGEPVFLCTKCEKYFGTVPFNEVAVERNIDSNKFLKNISESSVINTGDKVIFFNEDGVNDTQLRKLLYADRLRRREDVILLYDQVKRDVPFINYTFPEIEKYQKKNIFVDLYYYNKIFFENNNWVLNKGLKLYLDFMDRLINNPKIKSAGYTKKTIFIPLSDWSRSPMIWNFRESINPVSIIYQLMYSGMSNQLLKLFGDCDIVFMSSDKYFKMNFSQIDMANIKKIANTLKLFVVKMVKGEEFDASDMDTSFDNAQSKNVIKANIIDKIELSKGVDLTSAISTVKTQKKEIAKDNNGIVASPITNTTPQSKKVEDIVKDKEDDKNISKLALNKPDIDNEKKIKNNINIKKLADAIDDVVDNVDSEEDAWDMLDNEEIKQIIIDLDSTADDGVDMTPGRSSRMIELDKKLMEAEVKGKSIKEILEPKEEKKDTVTELKLSTPNEEWKNLTYMNFDKKYDIDKDIINCFRHFSNVSRPIAIRSINVEDNSTSEDRVELYTVEMEDYRGKRFTVKLDIPIMVDNRFLLRGNYKTIQTQFCNMPIIKTDFDTCQVVSNYMKIFIRRFGSGAGKSLPTVSKFLKAVKKYEGRKIKFSFGNNTKICSKYYLPIDYIDIAGTLSKIETDEFIIYFNQDEVREIHTIEEGKGLAYMYNKKTNEIVYYTDSDPNSFVNVLLDQFTFEDKYSDFLDLVYSATSSTVCAYSRCSIMNSQIPLIIICCYHEGLRTTLQKANISYQIKSTLTKEERRDRDLDWIKFKDGYVLYKSTYESSLLLNGLKTCPTDLFEIAEIDNKNMYLEFLDSFGGRIKADGLENFYDLMVDPITKEVLEFYKFPTDYVSILLYSNALLADNKFFKHTNTASKRIRRYELIAVYTYKVLADEYGSYANQLKHSRTAAEFSVKQSAVIDKFLTDTISSDDSCINALQTVETTNAVTSKGPSGMNNDRAYSLDKRTYDDSMLNILGMSTGFASNSGITRQITIDANVEGERGYVKTIDGDTSKMNTTKSLTVTEALTPFGSTRDDPMRTAMTFIQTAKHTVRTEDSDPLLVTNGSDEALAYLTSDRFAFKAKKEGKIIEMDDKHILIEYVDGAKEYINLVETIEKNSDGGYYVPLKLDAIKGLKVGSKVQENQIVAYDKYSFSNSLGESDNIAYNIGKLAKVAIINTDEGFEDSGIITERMAEKLSTRINLQFAVTLDKETTVLSMLKVGDKVEAGDNLITWQAPFDDEEADALMKVLTSDEVSELGKRKLKSSVTGKVTAIKMFRTIELEDMSESLRTIVDEYEKPYRELYEKYKENNLDISQIPAHYILPATGKLKKAQNAVVIEFYVEYMDTVGVGDKIVYFSANKATEKDLIPKGKEPYTAFRPNEPIDAFVSETSIDKRMVCSTPIYGSLQKLMIELDRSIKDIMGIPYDDSTV